MKQTLKLALEALEATSPLGFGTASDKRHYGAIAAIKEALAQQSNEQEINPKTTFDEVERGLQQSRMVIATLDSITTEQRQQINEPLLKAQLFLKAISKAVTETAIQKSNEQVEPLWYAVMSETAPIINKAIRSEDVANEYADKCRETYSGVEVIALFAHPPVPTAQPKEPEQEPDHDKK